MKTYKLGELITQRREKNNETGLPIRGVSREGLIPPKQIDADTSIYNVFYLRDFIFNPARMELNSIAFNDKYEKAICSSLYEVFYVHREDIVLPEYLKLIVKQDWFTRYCEFLGQGSAREYCRFANISEINIELPDIETQKKAVYCDKVINERIALKRRINDNLAQQAICIIQKTKEQDSVAGKTWSSLTVQDLVDRSYIAPPMDGNHGEIHPKVSDYVASGVPFIMANNLNDGYVDYENCAFITEQQACTLRKGFAKSKDVLITHKATLGRIAIVSNEYETTILTPQVTYYRALNYISPEFLRYFFETSEFQKNFEAWAGAGSTRAYIGITKQLELPILLPNEDSMRAITESISKIEAMRYNNHLEIIKLSNMQKILLSEISSR